MSNFKAGDKVKIVSLDRSHMGRVHNGETVTIKEIKDMEWGGGRIEHYAMFEEFHEDGVWLNELESLEPQQKVTKQTQIVVADGNIRVTHTTNSKKDRVSFSGFGQAGHIKRENLDRVIAMLTKLKGEIENENV